MTNSESGFTLLELLLVIAIFGILATMSVPIIGQSLKRWRMEQFARTAFTAQQAARFHAITKQTQIQVRYLIDEDKITFYFCNELDASGNCPTANWQRYTVMAPLIPPNDSVDLWSVGDQTNGVACMYFKPSGQASGPYDRSTATGEDCPYDPIGSGIHITWRPNPDHNDSSDHCKWHTIFHPAQTGKASLLEYGAYPGSGGAFSAHDMGDPPACAS